MDVVFALLIGLGAGFLSGLLGIGGGSVIVPSLVFLGLTQHAAQGVSLLVIIPTAVAGSITHYRLGHVLLRYAVWIAPAALAGTLVGSLLVDNISEDILRRAFALILVYTSLRLLLQGRAKRGKPAPVDEGTS